MMDDLSSFFAKKAAKKKRTAAQDTESLVKRLEKAVKHQMQIDINNEEERVSKEREQAVETRKPETEDPEWIDLQEELDMDLASKGLKELDIEQIQEEDKVINNGHVEKPKTWNITKMDPEILEGDVSKPADVPPVVEEKKPARYITPHERQKVNDDKQPNIQDAEEFPSLMAAEDFSKKEHEKKKLKAQRAKEFAEREKELLARREKELNLDSANKLVDSVDSNSNPTASIMPAPKQDRYVPPHLRDN